MATNDLHIRIRATADTAAARKEIQGLAKQVSVINQNQRNALNVISGSGLNTQPISRIRNELDGITENINKGKISAEEWGTVWRNQSQIIKRQSALASAGLASMNDQMRGFKQGTLMMDDFNGAQVRFIDRMRLMASATGALSRQIVDFGKNMQWGGRQITVGFTVPFAIAAGLAAREFMQVEDQIVRFQKVFNEDMGTTLNEATDRVKNLASTITDTMGRAQEESLEVSATFAQMGKNIEEVEFMTEETMRLSTLGEVDISTSTDLIRGIQAVFKYTNDELKTSIDMLNAIENSTSLTVNSMAEAMPQLLPIFQQFNLSLGEGTSLLSGMNEILGNANEAATAFKAIAQRMFDPSGEAIDKFAQYGIDLEQIVANNADDLTGFLVDLGDILTENNVTAQQFAETFGNLMGVRQAGRGLSLITSVGDAMSGMENDTSRAMSVLTTETENAASAQIELNRQVNSLSGQFRRRINQMKIDIADIGETILEMAIPIVDFFAGIVNWIRELDEGTRKGVLILAGITAAIGPLVMGLGIFINLAGTVVGVLSKMFPRASSLTTAAAKASTLAIKDESMAASTLINQMFGLTDALNTASAANRNFAGSSREAAASAGRQAGSKAKPYFDPTLGDEGGYVDPYSGAVIPYETKTDKTGRTYHARTDKGYKGQRLPTTQYNAAKGTPAAARSTKRGRTHLAGGMGAAGAGLFLGTALISQLDVIDSAAGDVLNKIVMWGSAAAMIIPQFARLATKTGALSRVIQGVGVSVANMGGAIAGKGALGAAMGAGGAAMVGGASVLAAVGAVGFGIKRWIGHIDTAANRMASMQDVTANIGSTLGLSERGSNLIEVDTEGTVEDITQAVNEATSAISGLTGVRLERQARTITFDLLTRGADIETVRRIVEAMEQHKQFKLDIDLSDVETAMTQLREKIQYDIEGIFRSFETGAFNSSTMGRIFQFRDMSEAGKKEMEKLGVDFANILISKNGRVIEDTVKFVEENLHRLSDVQENYFVDFILEALNRHDLIDEVDNFEEMLAHVAATLGDEVTPHLREHNMAAYEAKERLKELETELQGIKGAADQTATGRQMADLADAIVQLHESGEITTEEMKEFLSASENLAAGLEPTHLEMDILKEVMNKLNASGDLDFVIRNFDDMKVLMSGLAGAGSIFVNWLQNVIDTIGVEWDLKNATEETDEQRQARLNAASTARWAGKAAQEQAIMEAQEKAELEAVEEESDEHSKRISAMRSAIQESLNDYISEVMEGLQDQQEAIKETYDTEINAIKESQKAYEEKIRKQRDEEKKLEDQRIAAFEAEIDRQKKLSDQLSEDINFDAAIARGDLDAASQIRQDRMFGDIDDAFDEFKRTVDERSKLRDEEVDNAIEASKKQTDTEVAALEEQRDAALEAHEERMEMIQNELDELKRTTPATVTEWNNKLSQINSAVRRHGGVISGEIQEFGVNAWQTAMKRWQQELDEDAKWESMRESVKKGMETAMEEVVPTVKKTTDAIMETIAASLYGDNSEYRKLFGDAAANMNQSIFSGDSPLGNNRATPPKNNTTDGKIAPHLKDSILWQKRDQIMHSGGTVVGRGEVPAILEAGEFVMNTDTVKNYGIQALEAMNAQRWHEGGMVGPSSGTSTGGLFGMFSSAIANMLGDFGGIFGGLFGGLGGLLGRLFGGGSDNLGDTSMASGSNPVPGGNVISEFGDPRGGGRKHEGIDIGNDRGSPVRAAFAGNVVAASVGSGGFGKRVWIHSPQKGLYHAYAHLDSIRTPNNVPVTPGSLLGTVGTTGNAQGTPPHLHWSANPHGRHSERGSINPRRLLQLDRGGSIRFNNTIANLHKGEHVLRAPTSKRLERGIENLERSGGGTSLTIQIESFHGTEDNIDRLANKVEKVLNKKQDARGRRKVFG